MNLQVQPLKVLATREVVTKRLDYSNYLNGTTKDELDGLGRLAGNYKIHASKTTIYGLNHGKKAVLVSPRGRVSNWEDFKECFEITPIHPSLIKFIEGKEEFSIVESKTWPRKWVISDVDGMDKVWLTARGDLIQRATFWGRYDHFIEDGTLVFLFELYNERMGKIINVRDSITTDKQGNVLRKYIWTQAPDDLDQPNDAYKITKVMWAHKLPAHICSIL